MEDYYKQCGDYFISTDKSKLDIQKIHQFLSTLSYWARDRSRETVIESIANSLCFGIYTKEGQQAGFARIVTDYATFAWLCDVFILPEFRAVGLGKLLIDTIVKHPELENLKRILLATRDAHDLYRFYGGFENLAAPEKWMERCNLPPAAPAESGLI